jgi:winged helix DNA-binding protein
MTVADITRQRLINQQIISPQFSNPADLVSWMGAVQSQDFAAAKWALGLRLPDTTDKDIELAFNKGEILRTHMMRPTWHFVAPGDIRWLLKLTAPRVIAIINNSGRKLGLDEVIFKRTNKLIAKALNGMHLTRTEIEAMLNKAGIVTGDLHMIHLMMRAELDGLICSGPRKGKQFTYALLEERVPQAKQLEKDEALAELTGRYFISHGPATVQDFVWWSGLKTTDAMAGIQMRKSKLERETINGQTYWFSDPFRSTGTKRTARLLPNFDEYMVAYKDRNLLVDNKKGYEIPGPSVLLNNAVLIDGMIVGTWKRAIKKDNVEVAINHFHTPEKSVAMVIAAAAKQYGRFMGLPVDHKGP